MNDLVMAIVHREFGHDHGFLRKPMFWKLLYFVSLKSGFRKCMDWTVWLVVIEIGFSIAFEVIDEI